MPSTLNRYIFREITVPFILGLTAFTGALLLTRFLNIADLVVTKGVPIAEICLMILYLLPTFALVTIPMALLLAILLAFGRLSADSEVIAMKASGMGMGQLMLPVLAFTAITTLSTFAIAVFAAPAGHSAFKGLLASAIENGADLEIRERVFLATIPGVVIYVNNFDKDTRTIKGIMIQDDRNPENPLTIFAGQGAITFDKSSKLAHLRLTDGSIHNIHKINYRLVSFREYELNLQLPGSNSSSINRSELDMTLQELDSAIKGGGKDPRMKKIMELEFHKRFATPFACLVFAIAAVPLGINNRRSGKGGGFAISIGLIIIYYITQSTFSTVGEKGLIHAALAMWAPNAIFLILGTWFFVRSATERTVLGPFAPALIAYRFRKIISGGKRSA